MHKTERLPNTLADVAFSRNGDIWYAWEPKESKELGGQPKDPELEIIESAFEGSKDEHNGWIYGIPHDSYSIRVARGTQCSALSDGRLVFLRYDGNFFKQDGQGGFQQLNVGAPVFHMSVSPDDRIWTTSVDGGRIVSLDDANNAADHPGNGWLIAGGSGGDFWTIRKNDPSDPTGSLHGYWQGKERGFPDIEAVFVAVGYDGSSWLLRRTGNTRQVMRWSDEGENWIEIPTKIEAIHAANVISPVDRNLAVVILGGYGWEPVNAPG